MDTAKYSMNYEEEDTEALIESDIADSKIMGSSVKKSREPNEADDKDNIGRDLTKNIDVDNAFSTMIYLSSESTESEGSSSFGGLLSTVFMLVAAAYYLVY